MTQSEKRTYRRQDVVSFRTTKERFGGLSNMAPGFPIRLHNHQIRTAEALYQACRFPHLPEVQQMILRESSPMTAKMRSKPFRDQSRPDWHNVRVPIMKWCLRVKLVCNWSKFSTLLLQTELRAIVEDSRKDDFWGAKRNEDSLEGQNVLGRLLMELRDKIRTEPKTLEVVNPLPITDFFLLGEEITVVAVNNIKEITKQNSQDINEHRMMPGNLKKKVTFYLDYDVFKHFCEDTLNGEDLINDILRKNINYFP